MRLSVKVLGGVECCVDAQEDYTVDQLKADIEAKLKLGKAEQKLLYKGKPLQDGTFLSAYKLTDGSKLNLVLKREAVTPTTNSGPSRQNYRPTNEISVGTLDEELVKALRKHFKSDADTKKVIATFMSIYQRKVSALSLDDVERISRNFQETQKLSF